MISKSNRSKRKRKKEEKIRCERCPPPSHRSPFLSPLPYLLSLIALLSPILLSSPPSIVYLTFHNVNPACSSFDLSESLKFICNDLC